MIISKKEIESYPDDYLIKIGKVLRRWQKQSETDKRVKETSKEVDLEINRRLYSLTVEYESITGSKPNKSYGIERLKKEVSELKLKIDNFYK